MLSTPLCYLSLWHLPAATVIWNSFSWNRSRQTDTENMRLLLKYCILTLDSCLSFADFNVSNHGLPAPALHRTRRVALWGRPARVPTATVESAAGWAGLGSMRQCCNRMSGPSGEVFGEQIVQDVGWLIMSVNFGELAINPSSWIPMPRCYAGPVRLVRKFLLPPKHGKVSEICKASRNFKVQSWKLRDSELPKVPKHQNHPKPQTTQSWSHAPPLRFTVFPTSTPRPDCASDNPIRTTCARHANVQECENQSVFPCPQRVIPNLWFRSFLGITLGAFESLQNVQNKTMQNVCRRRESHQTQISILWWFWWFWSFICPESSAALAAALAPPRDVCATCQPWPRQCGWLQRPGISPPNKNSRGHQNYTSVYILWHIYIVI